ncbi:MAG: MG2 domain-containing protein [Collinsella sp.]
MLQAHHKCGNAKPAEENAETTVTYTDDATDFLQAEIASITEPNGAFEEDARTLLSGESVSMAFIYRNAASASITARPVNVRLWQEERMNTLLASKKLGKKYEKKYSNFNTLLSNLLRDKSAARYLGKEIKGKSISLDPGNQHLNRIAQLPIPATQPGWYLLTVTLNNGYQFHRLLSLSDLVLIRRSIPEGNLWFLAEAKTGAPVEGGKISLLRYRKDKTLQTKQVKGTTDKNGVLIETLPPNDSNSSTYYNFLGIATHGDSYTVTGERNVWYSGESRMSLNNKASNSYGCFFLESQPVYRPGQTARFRGVLFRPDFANPGTKDCAGKKLTLTILGPTGDKGIFPKQTVTTDATGGFDLELLIPNGAPLGQYRVTLDFRESDRTLYAPCSGWKNTRSRNSPSKWTPRTSPSGWDSPSPFPSRRTIMREAR